MATYLQRFTRYLKHTEKSALTIDSYTSDMLGFEQWFDEANEESLAPASITSIDLREYKRYLQKKQHYKPSSINRKLATLKTFLNWAEQASLLEHYPKFPKFVKETRTGPRWLSKKAQNNLLRVVERGGRVRDMAIIKALMNTGLRVQELCDLIWKDATITKRKGLLVVRSGKGGKRREIPLNKDARRALTDLGYAKKVGSRKAVFQGQRGAMSATGIQLVLRKCGDQAKISKFYPHALRHTFCKNLVNAEVSLEKVALLAGHDGLETTRRYCEPSQKDLQDAVELIGEEK